MKKIINNIPNTITCLNLGAGCMAVITALTGTGPLWGMKGFQWAFIFIAIGAVADFCDGFAARLLHAYSNLGKELDSLCDLVTFGVAPSLIMWKLMSELSSAEWVCWTALLIPLSAAVRLARFNIDSRQSETFIGMPVPANAIFWIGYASLLYEGVGFLASWYVFLPVVIAECWLMNSPFKMLSLKFKTYGFRENLGRYLLIMATAICCFTLGVSGLLWLIVFYVFLSVALKN